VEGTVADSAVVHLRLETGNAREQELAAMGVSGNQILPDSDIKHEAPTSTNNPNPNPKIER
jgi:hypothetical protein